MKNKEINSIILQTKKEDSSFLYFILESKEGMCFYSTLPHEKGDLNRQVIIRFTEEFSDQIDSTLNHLKKYISYSLINDL